MSKSHELEGKIFVTHLNETPLAAASGTTKKPLGRFADILGSYADVWGSFDVQHLDVS